MKKAIYIILVIVTISLIGYILYYILTHPKKELTLSVSITTATSTESSTTALTIPDKNTLTTKNGKQIKITEENPVSESLSTIILTPRGFSINSPILIEKNKLTQFFLADINNDTYDELVLITQSGGSGSYSEATIYTTASDTELIPVLLPEITEKDTKKGGLFEGYMGHDTFAVEDGILVRNFPTYTKKDTNDNPTGPIRKVFYLVSENAGVYSAIFSKGSSTPIVSTSSTKMSVQLPPATLSKSEPTVVPSANASNPLLNTSWIWLNTTSHGVITKAPLGKRFIITFGSKGIMTSTTDCNSLRGDYAVDQEMIEFGSFTSTMMYCDNSKESDYSSLLSQATSYRISSTILTLSLSNGSTMAFSKK
jgi:heat shock protein HslJ